MSENFSIEKTRKKLHTSIQRIPRLVFPMKDVESLRKASGSEQSRYDPEISEWGNPSRLRDTLCPKPLSTGREVGELKYLSSRRK